MMADFQDNFIQVYMHRFCEHLMGFDKVILHCASDFTLTLLVLIIPFRSIFSGF